MISLNTVSTPSVSTLTPSSTISAPKAPVGNGAQQSAIVDLQSKLSDSVSVQASSLNKESAKQMAADLAALLSGGQGMSSQANINSLDALRLLA